MSLLPSISTPLAIELNVVLIMQVNDLMKIINICDFKQFAAFFFFLVCFFFFLRQTNIQILQGLGTPEATEGVVVFLKCAPPWLNYNFYGFT